MPHYSVVWYFGCVALLALPVLCAGTYPSDPPALAPSAALSLDGAWTLSCPSLNRAVAAQVPGDIITDLQRAGVVGEPLYDMNFKSTVWDSCAWTLSRTFQWSVSASSSDDSVILVFDGVKMAADVTLNGQVIASISDQFLRVVVPVADMQPSNTLSVSFPSSSDARNSAGRFMACSGAWDWAPYGVTFTSAKDHTFSKGIIKSVYILRSPSIFLLNSAVAPEYTGAYMSAPPPRGNLIGPFTVRARLFIRNTQNIAATAQLTLQGDWCSASTSGQECSVLANITLPPGDSSQEILFENVKAVPWWPNTLGVSPQVVAKLYTATISISSGASSSISVSKSVGFRVAHLVTGDDSTADKRQQLLQQDGSSNFTMRLKVNGADVWARGGNMIPMEELEGRQSVEAYRALVASAAAAHFNMLRVWGGGVFLPEEFYSACDEAGIMVYQDMMYGQPWFGGFIGTPMDTPQQDAEIRYNIRRLSHHASIVVWNGGNEWQGSLAIFDSFVLRVVAEEDVSRPVWPISPSAGWASGVSALTGLPNGKPLRSNPIKGEIIETHGPYQHGSGFKTVNAPDPALQPFPANIPPAASNQSIGTSFPGHFASEFGCSVMSSFESMSPTLQPADWSPHSAKMYERNYPCDSLIAVYFGVLFPPSPPASTFLLQKFTYLCMIAQTLEMKSDIEVRRSRNEHGTLTWQLGEIWPTGGWGSLEYGTVGWLDGQVLGGRWKPLHHMMEQHLYRDVVAICGADALCLVKNSNPLTPVFGKFQAVLFDMHSQTETEISSTYVALSSGPAIHRFCLGDPFAHHDCPSYPSILAAHKKIYQCATDSCVVILRLNVVPPLPSEHLTVSEENVVFIVPPANMTVPASSLSFNVSQPHSCALQPSGTCSTVLLSVSSAPAMFVTLVTKEQGRFLQNNLFLIVGDHAVEFLHYGKPQSSLLHDTLRVEHLYMMISHDNA